MIKQPVGIVKLTNVALIKYKVKGKKLEIACYSNKALDFRSGKETSLDDVLQIMEVYTNTHQGQLANKKLLDELFPGKTKNEIIEEILAKGEMQVSAKEREALLENTYKDIVNIIASKVVHPKSKRLFSTETIKAALKEVNFNVQYNKPAKKQAQDAIKVLEKFFHIERTSCLVKLSFKIHQAFEELKLKYDMEVQSKTDNEVWVLLSLKEYASFIEYVAQNMQDTINAELIDGAFCNRETKNIHDNVELAMEKRKNVKFPKAKSEAKPNGEPEEDLTKGINNMQIRTTKTVPSNKDASRVCTTCLKTEFNDLDAYKDHIKSEWHKANLSRKMKSQPALSNDEFVEYSLLNTM